MGADLGGRRLEQARVGTAALGPHLAPAEAPEQEIGRGVAWLRAPEESGRRDDARRGVLAIHGLRGGHRSLRSRRSGATRSAVAGGGSDRLRLGGVGVELQLPGQELSGNALYLGQRLLESSKARRGIAEPLLADGVERVHRVDGPVEIGGDCPCTSSWEWPRSPCRTPHRSACRRRSPAGAPGRFSCSLLASASKPTTRDSLYLKKSWPERLSGTVRTSRRERITDPAERGGPQLRVSVFDGRVQPVPELHQERPDEVEARSAGRRTPRGGAGPR